MLITMLVSIEVVAVMLILIVEALVKLNSSYIFRKITLFAPS